MARRHQDRKPGQRTTRPSGGKVGGRKGPTKKVGKKTGGIKAGGSSAGKPVTRKPPSTSGGPAKKRPTRGSKRRAQGLVVTSSSEFDGSAANVRDGKVRLNHFLAKAGICSRRNADELIVAGRVEINGEIVTELGVRVDPTSDDVRFDGVRLEPEKAVYVLLNKPKGVVCTNARNEQKKRVVDLLPTIRGRVFTVGRLDMDSEGLLLVTNDGGFAQEMTHPRYGISKLYAVVLRGRIDDEILDKARGGVWLSEGPTGGMQVKIERLTKERSYLKVTLREGKNREIRRVFAKLGYPVHSLKRVRIGSLNLHGLSDGEWRFLQLDEVAKLRDQARSEPDDEPAASTWSSGARTSRAGSSKTGTSRAGGARSGASRSGRSGPGRRTTDKK